MSALGITKFDLGEQTGQKAHSQQISNDMHKARDEQNNWLFAREEWLTKSQVQGFFSRPVATRRRQQGTAEGNLHPTDLLLEDEEFKRQRLIDEVAHKLKPQHPLSYDTFNLCECARENKLIQFNVEMLKQIFRHFQILFKSRDRKKDLIEQLTSLIEQCTCFSPSP